MTMKIEVGKFYRTRDGRKVGPMVFGGLIYTSPDGITFRWSDDPNENSVWADNGCYFGNSERARSHDLIAEWTDEPEALDLTEITTPFGLLPPETQQALRDHGGPYQMYRYDGWRFASPRTDLWTKEAVFRVNPHTAPREGYAVTLFRSAREAKTAHPGCDPIFVREVKE